MTGIRDGGPAPAQRRVPAAGYWFPLIVFGLLSVASLPFSKATSAPLPTGTAVFTRVVYLTAGRVEYLGGGSANPPFPFPLGWYWVGTLAAGTLLTAAWYRWRDRRTGTRTPLRPYLVTGLALAAIAAALPLLGWGVPIELRGPEAGGWLLWLDVLWRLGIFVLLAVAAGLAILAWAEHSRVLAVITVLYAAAVCLSGWVDVQQSQRLVMFSSYPYADPAVLLPAAVLLLAGLGAALAGRLRALPARRRRTA